jgi:hypothetical protein
MVVLVVTTTGAWARAEKFRKKNNAAKKSAG